MPQLQVGFRGVDGTDCRFVDTAVYTRNRQFRPPLNHNYPTQNALFCDCQALLLSLRFAWRVSPGLNKVRGKYLPPLSRR